MKILCEHGYFRFQEREAGDVNRFASVYGVTLVSLGDYSTFDRLSLAEEYCLTGKPYLNLVAMTTYEGTIGEIFRKNGFVYSLGRNMLIPFLTIFDQITLQSSELYYVARSLIQPGSLLSNGDRIMGYKALLDWDTMTFRYTEIDTL